MNGCGQCGKKIEHEPALLARGQLWHVTHFACTCCGCRIQEDEKFEIREESSVCNHCYISEDKTYCAGCLTGIDEHFVEAGGRIWHPTCFTCSVCLQPLKDAFTENDHGLPMHHTCFWEHTLNVAIAETKTNK